MHIEIWRETDAALKRRDYDGAINQLTARLRAAPSAHYAPVASVDFTNEPGETLEALNDFITEAGIINGVEATYLEMNGFDLNVDSWYSDFFGYPVPGDLTKPYAWVSDWKSPEWPSLDLKGMEVAQEAFRTYRQRELWNDRTVDLAHKLAQLLVMAKFVRHVARATQAGPLVRPIPIFASAHDFDIIGRVAG
jgi:hypothetical protein